MARISLYLDEHIQLSLAEALGTRGIDALTTQNAGNIGLDDVDQLIFAPQHRRVLFSYTKRHFAVLHHEWMATNKYHAGTILSDQ